MAHRTKESLKPIRKNTINARIDDDTKLKLTMLQEFYQKGNDTIISIADVLEVIISEVHFKEFNSN